MIQLERFCLAAGAILLSLSIYIWMTKSMEAKEVLKQDQDLVQMIQEAWTDQPDSASVLHQPKTSSQDELVSENYLGILTIPSIGLELPVLNSWSQEDMNSVPCRYYGSVEEENLVIAAHNSWQHFGNLDQVQYGDQAYLQTGKDKVIAYELKDIQILEPDQTETMLSSDYDLSLYTCTRDALRRYTLRFRQIDFAAQ